LQSDVDDRAHGCILGAFVGDSLGSFLEFKTGVIGNELVDEGMLMQGGGCWRLAPGQVTDDSELAMMLMNGLVGGAGVLDAKRICSMYAFWGEWGPFDIGMTTRSGLSLCSKSDPRPRMVY
jgi:ADP-ribosyl-[dinitrogen reductase] hydrolase